MDLLPLKYFQVTARMENMTRAAQELRVAQPSLSKTISRLETQVGVPLFDRQGKKIKLNQFGKIFLSHVNRSLMELEEGVKEISDLASRDMGSVTVASATARLLPGLIREYLTVTPQVKFRLTQVTQHSELFLQLINGEVDFSISSLAIRQKGAVCRPLIREEIFLAVPQGHRLAERKGIHLKEIADDPLISYTTECGLGEIVNQFCLEADFLPNMAFECTSPEVICELVRAGLGVAFLPEYLWDMINTDSLVKLRLSSPDCHRQIWLSWMEDRYLSLAALEFRKFIMNYFS